MGTERGVFVADLDTGRVVRRFEGGKGTHAVAFSPDSKTLATGSPERIQIWDLATGKVLLQLRDGFGAPYFLTLLFAPDGKSLATGSSFGPNDGTTRLWDLTTGKQRWQRGGLNNRAAALYPLAFSSDGKTLLVQENYGAALRILDTVKGEELRQFKGPKKHARVAVSRDGRRLASFDWDAKKIRLWDLDAAKELRPAPGDVGDADFFGLSSDGKILAHARKGEDIRLLDTTTGAEIRRIASGLEQVESLEFLPGDKRLVFRL
jgi:WD40 repeat protein